jgi:multisubunit Na+/H+ antiporter MnhG subunit
MDELDLLKKDWKKQESSYPKLSYNEIYKIIHKKSSSIVKWILIICIAEFLFWGFINLLIPDRFFDIYEKLHLKTFLNITYIFHYIIVVVFIYLFYKNYSAICVIDNTSLLMKKIIKTRKTVNYYVYYNIIMTVILSVVVNIIMFSDSALLNEAMNPKLEVVDEDKFFYIMLIAQIIGLVIMVGLLWLYYKLIYGILLKKLTKNFKELKKIEV